jgi:hypothetical protein
MDKKWFELALPVPHSMADAFGRKAVGRVAVERATLIAPATPVARHDGLDSQRVALRPPFPLW